MRLIFIISFLAYCTNQDFTHLTSPLFLGGVFFLPAIKTNGSDYHALLTIPDAHTLLPLGVEGLDICFP